MSNDQLTWLTPFSQQDAPEIGRVEGAARKRTVSPPSSHRACGFPAHGVPAHFTAGRHDLFNEESHRYTKPSLARCL
jgi:hypothetical protein